MQKGFEKFLGGCVKATIFRDKPIVVAIGGSVGKTSARNALSLALSGWLSPDEVRASKKNFNNELGIPLSVFACDAPGRSPFKWLVLLVKGYLYAVGIYKLKARYLILEMAADHPGDLDYLLSVAPPQVVIMTAMGAEHTEFFGSVESAVEEERKMLKAIPPDGEAVLNADDSLVWESRDLVKAEKVSYGKNPSSVVNIQNTRLVYDPLYPKEAGLEMELRILKNRSYYFKLKGVFGEAHAYAIAAAVAFCISMDHMSAPAIEYIKDHYSGVAGRTRLIPGIKQTMLLDDSYNAQPQAMEMAVRELANFPVPPGGRRIAALGDMLELGSLSQTEHEKIGQLVAQSNIDFLVCCGKLAAVIGQSAARAGMPQDRIVYFDKSPEAGLHIQQNILQKNDVVLIKGSQGSRMEKITKELMSDPLLAPQLLVRQSPEWLKK
ncbi:MAG: Mur ligase family protein [Patescibacteria group bacterium]|jgi:UDP-N-acetylmuramoyl-tripeptide--D-alanyl-D-alanine ligase